MINLREWGDRREAMLAFIDKSRTITIEEVLEAVADVIDRDLTPVEESRLRLKLEELVLI